MSEQQSATEQEFLEDNIATVAFHLAQPGAGMRIDADRTGLLVEPGEVLQEIARRLTVGTAQASEDWHEDFRRRTRALSQGSDAQAAIEQAEVDVSPDIESSKTAPLNRCISVPVSLIRALRDRLQQEDSFVWLDEIQMLDAALSAVPPSPGAGEWDKGEHEGCGIDSQRTMVRFDSQLAMQQVLEFLNSIEGAGYGGMASFEIAREYVRTLAVPSTPETTRNLVESLCEDCPKPQCLVCPRRAEGK